jgi:hypothetical protein
VAGPEEDQVLVDQGTVLARPRTALAACAGPCIRHEPSRVVLLDLADVPALAPHGLALVPGLGLARPAPVWAAQVA